LFYQTHLVKALPQRRRLEKKQFTGNSR